MLRLERGIIMGLSLYEIDFRLESLLLLASGNFVDESTGEVLTKEMVDDLYMERETKIENCLLFVKNMNAEAEMIKAEIDNLTARMKACKAKAEWCKNYVANALAGEKFKTAKVSVTYRKSEAVELQGLIIDVPNQYLKFKEAELDKTAVKKAIKAGEEVPGCVLVERSNIVIK